MGDYKIVRCCSKPTDMFTEGNKRYWKYTIPLANIFDYVNVNTVIENRKNGQQVIEEIFTDNDKDLLSAHITRAVANVYHILARRMENPPTIEDDIIQIVITVGENHDDTMANVLYLRIADYLNQYAFFMWRGLDVTSLSFLEDEIRHTLHYRKHSVSKYRKIRNIF